MHERAATTTGDHVAQNREAWDRMAADYVEAVAVTGPATRSPGASSTSPNRGSVCCRPIWPAWMRSSSVAGPGTSRPGWPGAGRARSASTTLRRSWRRRGASRRSSGSTFPLHLGDAEQTPFADESFDFAISEYGAAIWCDPYRWIPEAARILRPGGRLSFLGNSVLLMLATPNEDEDAPASEQLERPLFGMHRFAWADGSVEFHLPHGEMIRLLRDSGFEVEDLVEVQIPEGATTSTHSYAGVGAPLAGGRGLEGAQALRRRGEPASPRSRLPDLILGWGNRCRGREPSVQ